MQLEASITRVHVPRMDVVASLSAMKATTKHLSNSSVRFLVAAVSADSATVSIRSVDTIVSR